MLSKEELAPMADLIEKLEISLQDVLGDVTGAIFKENGDADISRDLIGATTDTLKKALEDD